MTYTESDSELVHAAALTKIGAEFHGRGWSLGTSSNYSVVLDRDPLRLLVTASGKDKSSLDPMSDFVVVDTTGHAAEAGAGRPSAETLLHVVLVDECPEVGAVLHTHSAASTILSDRFAAAGGLYLEGYEMLKGLEGIGTHEERLWVPVFENTQDIPALAKDVRDLLAGQPELIRYGFLIRRHGLYTWGHNLFEARRHIEIFEFLFDVTLRQLALGALDQ